MIGVLFAKIIAFFAVLFTGRYPRGIFDFVLGVLRWSWRVTAYVYLLRDEYPPFSLDDDPSYPATLEIEYPEDGIDNWRPLVQWLLIIPYAIVAGLLASLAGIVAFIGVFVILFTKELPDGMFKLILIPYRWQFRSQRLHALHGQAVSAVRLGGLRTASRSGWPARYSPSTLITSRFGRRPSNST